MSKTPYSQLYSAVTKIICLPAEKNRDHFLPLRGAWSSVRVFRKD